MLLIGNLGISIIAASHNALVDTGKDHCTVDYELYSVMKEWLMRIIRASFESCCPQNPVVIKQMSLSSSFITYWTVHQYTSYVEYVTLTAVFRVIKMFEEAEHTISNMIYETIRRLRLCREE
jgi:hypothetical protein